MGKVKPSLIALFRVKYNVLQHLVFYIKKGYMKVYIVYCSFISPQLLKNMKGQFTGLLYSNGFIHSPNPKYAASNFNSENLKLVKAVLCAGLYPNVVKIEQTNPKRLLVRSSCPGEIIV